LTDPVISVIIPTLQEVKYIERTLGQFTPALRERHRVEIIVSDGGSTDGTIEKSRDLADVVLVLDGGRQNISMGRNVGARRARGEYLVFINADTVVGDVEDFFSRVQLLKDRKIAGITCNVYIYPEAELFSDRIFHKALNAYFRFLNVCGVGMGRGECQIVRKELFMQVNGYDETIAAGEDFDLFVRLRRLGRITFLKDLKVYESPRRFRRYGYFNICMLWFVNAVFVLVRGKSMSKEWEPVR
jgi:glycosyltransferase involved in cell wall biosynthesis